MSMKKIAFFREKRFENNNFHNTDIDKNLSPFNEIVKINGKENTISFDKLSWRYDKDEFIILCRKQLSIFCLLDYIQLFIKRRKNKKYHILLEPFVVAPLWYSNIFHTFFEKVFTWKDDLMKKKYIKMIRPQSYFWLQEKVEFKNKRFIVLMNANKYSYFCNELYSERVNFIKYCENNNKNLDIYWSWWEKANFKQKIFGFKKFYWYKWKVDNKIKTIWNYKFNVCFENMKNTSWYITEKIRDSFKAKTVPIYWWASNITEYIPEDCFIDYRKYVWKNNELFSFLETMNEEAYDNYIKNIEIFLQTDHAKKWFDAQWAKKFIKDI